MPLYGPGLTSTKWPTRIEALFIPTYDVFVNTPVNFRDEQEQIEWYYNLDQVIYAHVEKVKMGLVVPHHRRAAHRAAVERVSDATMTRKFFEKKARDEAEEGAQFAAYFTAAVDGAIYVNRVLLNIQRAEFIARKVNTSQVCRANAIESDKELSWDRADLTSICQAIHGASILQAQCITLHKVALHERAYHQTGQYAAPTYLLRYHHQQAAEAAMWKAVRLEVQISGQQYGINVLHVLRQAMVDKTTEMLAYSIGMNSVGAAATRGRELAGVVLAARPRSHNGPVINAISLVKLPFRDLHVLPLASTLLQNPRSIFPCMGRRAKHYTQEDRRKSRRDYEDSNSAKAIRLAYKRNHPRRPPNLLEQLDPPPLTPEIAAWAGFKVPFSDHDFQRGCVIDPDKLWPYILPPPYDASDFQSACQPRPFRKLGELEGLVHGVLLQEERGKELQMNEDWNSSPASAAQACLELCQARLETFAQLRQLMDEEEEDADVDEISVYTRAMTQLHCGSSIARSSSFLVPNCICKLGVKSRTEDEATVRAWYSNVMAGEITPYVGRLSCSGARRNLYKGQKESGPAAPVDAPSTVENSVGGAKNGDNRLVPTKSLRFYPADNVRTQILRVAILDHSRDRPHLPRRLLPWQARRVHQAGQHLASGLLLITGLFKNGVPLGRVNQAYVIATSTKIDLEGFTVDEKLNDAYFAKSATKGTGSSEAEFFEGGKPKAKEAFPESKAAD
ncbi:60S ribosomal protein [Mycena kentingensis (nom. inval.)]|nr:60S ribosomal protein [Mycena kentingensis (nom. inval.)]